MDASDLQLNKDVIDPPENDDKFDEFCLAAVKRFAEDPGAQRNGVRGQAQQGVDIYARYQQGPHYWGFQSKKTDRDRGSLKKSDIQAEVAKAKNFKPGLKRYFILTTFGKDARLQEEVRLVSSQSLEEDNFSVDIWFWEDIKEFLHRNKDILYDFYPFLRPPSNTFKEGKIDEIKKNTERILDNQAQRTSIVNNGSGIINVNVMEAVSASSDHRFDVLGTKIDALRDLINKGNYLSALEGLESIKKNEWANLTALLKFRVLANLAAASSKVEKEDDAAKYFIEALQYSPEDEKALLNASTGFLIRGDYDEAEKLARKVLEKNSASNRAYSLLVAAAPDNKPVGDVLLEIPEKSRESSEVAFAAGFAFRGKDDLDQAVEWFEKALAADERENVSDAADVRGALAETLLQQVLNDHDFIYGRQFTPKIRKKLERAELLFKEAWATVSSTEMATYRVSWLSNRSIANKFLGDIDAALNNITSALEIKPSDSEFIKQKAILLFEAGKKSEAVDLIKTVQGYDSVPKITIPLIALLGQLKLREEAISLTQGLISKTDDKDALYESSRMLVSLLTESEKFFEAKALSDKLISGDPENIGYLIDAFYLRLSLRENPKALEFLNRAKGKIKDETSHRLIFELGSAFYEIDEFASAAELFLKIADTEVDSDITRKLINSYYRSGRLKEALRVAQDLRKTKPGLRYAVEMESAIFQEIQDLPSAKEVCRDYLKINPGDIEMRVRYAVILFRSGSIADIEELTTFLKSKINLEDLSFERKIQLIGLYEASGYQKEALALAYEIRRKFFGDPEAHMNYVTLFFRRQKDNDGLLEAPMVSEGTAVLLGDASGGTWYILDNRADALIEKNEINEDHPLYKKLIEGGKKVGDSITLKESGPRPEIVLIKEIKNKYVYAFHDSLNNFAARFPEAEGLWGVKVETPKNDKDIPDGLQAILEQVSQHDRRIKEIEQYYREGKLTIGAFATLVKKDVITTLGGLTSHDGPGVQAASGSLAELQKAVENIRLKPPKRLVLDPVALMTIHGVEMADALVKNFGRPLVAFSTLELFRERASEKAYASQGYMNVSKQGENFVREEITPEQIKKNIEYLNKIVAWIEKECEVVSPPGLIDIKRDEREHDVEMLGKESYDSLQIVKSSESFLLYTDDERLRSFLQTETGKGAGVWTHLLLMEMLERKVISGKSYAKATLKLINSKYLHTGISKEVLLEAAEQSQGALAHPLEGAIEILKEGISDIPSGVRVAIEFINLLWITDLPKVDAQKKEAIVNRVLDTLVDKRSVIDVVHVVKAEINRVFPSMPLQKEEILALVRSWLKTQGLPSD